MAKPQEVYRLTEIDPEFVSLVRAGANRQTSFLVVKTAKAVPAADADSETKQAALRARAEQYGIEARTDAALSYPAGAPTTERLYGDPVNLKYPLGGEDNAVDVARVRNALARFSQNMGGYSEQASQVKVLERIARAALAAGVDVTLDPDNPVHAALPADLREQAAKAPDDTQKETPAVPGDPPQAAGLSGPEKGSAPDSLDLSWMGEAQTRIDALLMDAILERTLTPPGQTAAAKADAPPAQGTVETVKAAAVTAPPASAPAQGAAPEVEQGRAAVAEAARLRDELAKAHAEIVAERARVSALKGAVGGSAVLPTGRAKAPAATVKEERPRAVWGGDLAEEAKRAMGAPQKQPGR